jgi:hypothetical protein
MTIIVRITVETATKDCRLAIVSAEGTSYLYDTDTDPILRKEKQTSVFEGHSCVLSVDNILAHNEHNKSKPTYEQQQATINELNAQVEMLLDELNNIGYARRFERSMFRDDSEFADWAQRRATHILSANPSDWLAEHDKAKDAEIAMLHLAREIILDGNRYLLTLADDNFFDIQWLGVE